jgi:hypothetical protein
MLDIFGGVTQIALKRLIRPANLDDLSFMLLKLIYFFGRLLVKRLIINVCLLLFLNGTVTQLYSQQKEVVELSVPTLNQKIDSSGRIFDKILIAKGDMSFLRYLGIQTKSHDPNWVVNKVVIYQAYSFPFVSPLDKPLKWLRVSIDSSIIKGCLEAPISDSALIAVFNSSIECIRTVGMENELRKWNRTALAHDSILTDIQRAYQKGVLTIDECEFRNGEFYLNSKENTYGRFGFYKNKVNRFLFAFNRDSIEGGFAILNPILAWHPELERPSSRFGGEIRFEDSYINSKLDINISDTFNTIISFRNVVFGQRADLSMISADTILFFNCRFEKQIPFELNKFRKKCVLHFLETDITQLKFDYFGRFRLMGSKEGEFDEELASSYETLLAYFKTQGKSKSYEILDIEFRHYKESQSNLLFRAWGLTEKYWWNYGYSKSRVILWIFAFLFIFYWINYCYWNSIKQTYNLPNAVERNEGSFRFGRTSWFIILLYTLFLFFSINIKLDRLNYQRPGWAILVLLQYTLGLVCLFFLVNAVFRP